jgi:hypothetical protein
MVLRFAPSFPRRRESIFPSIKPAGIRCLVRRDIAQAWIPACAGMTAFSQSPLPGERGFFLRNRYGALSTSTTSASSRAFTVIVPSLRIAAPSRASMRSPLTSMVPLAGTR